jgi:hypothetical protein
MAKKNNIQQVNITLLKSTIKKVSYKSKIAYIDDVINKLDQYNKKSILFAIEYLQQKKEILLVYGRGESGSGHKSFKIGDKIYGTIQILDKLK